MEFRLARIEDLKHLKIIYKEIIKNMNKNNIQIWDDIYPCEFFEDDINNKRLYVIADDEEIISAFALCDNNAGEAYVEWSEKSAKAMYIDRLGVNVEYSKKGIGQQMLNKAKEISKSIGAEYLRLFVVDINKPAIRLYQKNGFTKVDGVYDKDPHKYADAKKYDKLSYLEILDQGLQVMDSTATTLCMDNNIPILVFGLDEPGNIRKAVNGENIGTLVSK